MIQRRLPESHERALSRKGITFAICNAAILIAAYVFASHGFVASYGYHPLIVAFAIFLAFRIVLYRAEYAEDVHQWIKYATWGAMLLCIVALMLLNQPLTFQRMFTYVPLLGMVFFALCWRYGPDILSARGALDNPELYRREYKVSFVSATVLVVINELAIATGSDWIWILTIVTYMVAIKRLLMILVP